MEYFTLSNGVQMPAVGIGTFLMQPDQAEQAVYTALQMGYKMIDTANAYMNERAVGRAMRKSGIAREDIFLSTKIWASEYEKENAVEKTLEILGVPAQNNLGSSLAVLFCQFCKYALFQQTLVTVAQGIPCHQAYTVGREHI